MRKIKLAICGALLTVPYLVVAAQAENYTIQSTTGGTVVGNTVTSTNAAAVTGGGAFDGSTISSTSNGGRIGGSAVGASSSASIDVSIPAANIVTVPGAALQVNTTTIQASNNAGGVVSGGATFGASLISGGVSNSITQQNIGAAAGSGITFRAQ